jgi:hypothetical protein
MRALEAEAEAFLSGRFGVETGFTQAEDMTIFGPFGGPSSRMPMSELLPLQKVASSQFESGTTTFEVVKRITSGDLAVLVLIERSEVRIATTRPTGSSRVPKASLTRALNPGRPRSEIAGYAPRPLRATRSWPRRLALEPPAVQAPFDPSRGEQRRALQGSNRRAAAGKSSRKRFTHRATCAPSSP